PEVRAVGAPPARPRRRRPDGVGRRELRAAARRLAARARSVPRRPAGHRPHDRRPLLTLERPPPRPPAFKSRKSVSDGEFDLLVRHVYKVLLTRGMRGTVIYAVDPELRGFLSRLVPPDPA